MLADALADPGTLLLGALTGLAFGFLLQKGGLTRYRVIVGQFLLRDFTVLKVMLTAIVVGGAGIYGMRAAGVDVALHVKTTALLANLLGGLIFGVGMAVLGYCPGTGVAALGDGSRHVAFGVLGMLVGAGVYAAAFPALEALQGVGDLGKATLPTVTGLSPWWLLAAMVAAAALGLAALERWERRRGTDRAVAYRTG